jgi:hypothetical protein
MSGPGSEEAERRGSEEEARRGGEQEATATRRAEKLREAVQSGARLRASALSTWAFAERPGRELRVSASRDRTAVMRAHRLVVVS